MAGVKGRSGGARPGAGRKSKAAKAALTVPEGEDPLAFMLSVMKNPEMDVRVRMQAAISAAPYVHQKPGESGKKEAKDKAAKDAASNRFAPAAPPRLVVNNTKH